MPNTAVGRHRAPGRYNPLSELSQALTGATQPVMRTSAVLAASGGLVAAFAIPAQATSLTASLAQSMGAAVAAAPQAAPAVIAPSAGPLRATYGVIDVRAVAKPKPKLKPKPVVVVPARTQAAASRATTTPRPSVPARPSRPAARPTVPAAPKPPSTPTPPAASGVLGIAASLVGIPYVYGGSTPAGFDCSGFTMYVFAKVGISLPRTAAAQQAAATRVSSPQPGDLVFFGYPAYHVGIYAGGGMMYDSPRTGLSTSLRAIFSGVSGYGRP